MKLEERGGKRFLSMAFLSHWSHLRIIGLTEAPTWFEFASITLVKKAKRLRPELPRCGLGSTRFIRIITQRSGRSPIEAPTHRAQTGRARRGISCVERGAQFSKAWASDSRCLHTRSRSSRHRPFNRWELVRRRKRSPLPRSQIRSRARAL